MITMSSKTTRIIVISIGALCVRTFIAFRYSSQVLKKLKASFITLCQMSIS